MNANMNWHKAGSGLPGFSHGAERRWRLVSLSEVARIPVIAIAAAAITIAAPITFNGTAGGAGLALNAAAALGGGGKGGGGAGGVGGSNPGGVGGGNPGGVGGGNAGGVGGGNGANGAGSQGAGAGSSADAGGGNGGIVISVQPRVAMAVLTTSIRKRKPANQVESIVDPNQAISFFTELEGMNGRTITHRWIFGGDLKHEVPFEVRADKWRVWSTQLLPSTMAGTWNVQVVGADGAVLQAVSLDYQPTN